ncbi:AcrR family transcriptional regulator [Rhizobium leguminosarum]|uniref:AcrR family transcriptional regulator n=1 Tax=Rhizobium leguminosarum TaxID=384 RepID=A0AAE2MP03_RHILE|nr:MULTISPECIES: TetR/AcrR family transcriptional regulator [Rhizobium]MBB4292635.1 AcrR family transcriptional regulator [Rhizobium leguminosarum]MBB4298873.1 AcrR family transcriptional regulator [Rhizobium leguminosarum]MBB4310154.1 AcrR family transcriptional regulator [Rhizobium leguminosarum]MBB4434416.1 AcrR family transcriptional regulator [Rhizobium esperanzae]MBB4531312.1 AcrR family transcriptional regulator [Rhizobium leguminosarum]
MDQALNDTGWRGSQEGWLEAAYHSLLDSGVDSVKILPLAKRLNLSRTSFYWFFKDREELLAALVARWRDKNTGNIVKQSEAYAESLAEAMLNVFDCWLNNDLFDARFEFAVRSWALQSDEILAEVRQADQLRLDALKRMFIRFGLPEATSDVRARTTYLVQIGYISMQAKEELAVRMKRIPEYIAIYTGEVPQQRELDRFFSRHGYRPG